MCSRLYCRRLAILMFASVLMRARRTLGSGSIGGAGVSVSASEGQPHDAMMPSAVSDDCCRRTTRRTGSCGCSAMAVVPVEACSSGGGGTDGGNSVGGGRHEVVAASSMQGGRFSCSWLGLHGTIPDIRANLQPSKFCIRQNVGVVSRQEFRGTMNAIQDILASE